MSVELEETTTEAVVRIIWVPDKKENGCAGCFFNKPEETEEGDNCTNGGITTELNLVSCRSGGIFIGVYVDEIDEGD